ncbi:glycoside hydrolase family 16 protein [Rhizopogon salebrosus TDB-379]|nr:glycoside hydrolase family 16 protein [Rhizopogon salebrosus TDB-379]
MVVNAQSIAYRLNTSHIGYDFLDTFVWETEDDPTHGRVNYVDKATSLSENLTFVSESKFVMRADHTKKVANASRGRDSVRIHSMAAYDDALFVLDITHMPEGCSTWPAWWTLSQEGPWPQGGEIDIIEGVNLQEENLSSLHTTPNCTMPQFRPEKGSVTSTDCDTNYNYNQGCGVSFPERESYGSGFNAEGGGFYIMEKNHEKGISVWFFRRWNMPLVGAEPNLDLVLLTVPDAYFPTQDNDEDCNCSYPDHFNAHEIIFDLTFCGDWAGAVWSSSSCASKASSCASFVDNNPSEFSDAYWEINSLKIYSPCSDDD